MQAVASYHDQYQSVVARISQRLALSNKEWQEYEANKQPTDTSSSDQAVEVGTYTCVRVGAFV